MKKKFYFIVTLIREIIDDDVGSLGGALTYQLLLAFFPFLIFLMTLIGYLPIDGNYILDSAKNAVPSDIYNLINTFVNEVVNVKRLDLLSISLFLAIWSTSSGIVGLMIGLNKAYDFKEKRNFIVVRLISFLLIFVFIVGLLLSLIFLVFGDTIQNELIAHKILTNSDHKLFSFLRYITTTIILIFVFLFMYKFAVANNSSFKSLIPGSVFASVGLTVGSYGFNIYINNFADYSKIYGSIAGLFILIMWLSLISYLLLIGGEINAILKRQKTEVISTI